MKMHHFLKRFLMYHIMKVSITGTVFCYVDFSFVWLILGQCNRDLIKLAIFITSAENDTFLHAICCHCSTKQSNVEMMLSTSVRNKTFSTSV